MSYEIYSEKMLELVDDYRNGINEFKDLFVVLEISDITNAYSLLYGIYYATRVVADEIGLDKELQHEYIPHFLDDLFEFDNVFIEQYDRLAFEMMLKGLELCFDAVGAAFSIEGFKKIAGALFTVNKTK